MLFLNFPTIERELKHLRERFELHALAKRVFLCPFGFLPSAVVKQTFILEVAWI
jgi:hypothetical protein